MSVRKLSAADFNMKTILLCFAAGMRKREKLSQHIRSASDGLNAVTVSEEILQLLR